MDKAMLVTIFVLGVLLIVISIIALFVGRGTGDGGEISFLGFKISGGSARVIFLLVGVVFTLSASRWYHNLNQVATLTQTVATTEADKNELADAAATLFTSLDQQKVITEAFRTRIPAAQLTQLQQQRPALFVVKPMQFSPRVAALLKKKGVP
jgi:hypothetical protein